MWNPHGENSLRSLSARRAWIEISMSGLLLRRSIVALRKESVDRNAHAFAHLNDALGVALRKESVDRNVMPRSVTMPAPVALRKESVDRNIQQASATPSAAVALRKESVDRNDVDVLLQVVVTASLSARRAWIEIMVY